VGDAPARGYFVVKDQAGLAMVTAALANAHRVGLDLETTGLDPRKDRVRLLSLAVDTADGGQTSYLVDCFSLVDPSPVLEALAGKAPVLPPPAFALSSLPRLGSTPSGKVHDTMLLAQLLTAGTGAKVTLAECCRRWLKRSLDKSQQKSDWTGNMTD